MVQASQIKSHPRFEKLLRPLSREEYDKLEYLIKRDGCKEPVQIWNGYLIDGYNRRRICEANNLPFAIDDMTHSFSSEDEVSEYMLTKQLGRRNLTKNERTYYIGELHSLSKKTVGRPKTAPQVKPEPGFTAAQVEALKSLSSNHEILDVLQVTTRENGSMDVAVDGGSAGVLYFDKEGKELSLIEAGPGRFDAPTFSYLEITGIGFAPAPPPKQKPQGKLGQSDPIPLSKKAEKKTKGLVFEVPYSRLAKDGDIEKSCSSDTIATKQTIRSVFTFEGSEYVAVGGVSNADGFNIFNGESFRSSMTAHKVVKPEDFEGPTYGYSDNRKPGYHGVKVKLKNTNYILSDPKITLVPELNVKTAFRLFEVDIHRTIDESGHKSDFDWWRSRWYEFMRHSVDDTKDERKRKNEIVKLFPEVWDKFFEQFTGTKKPAPERTSAKIGQEFGVSEKTVRRAEKVAEAANQLPEEKKNEFLAGKVSVKEILKERNEALEKPLRPVEYQEGQDENTLRLANAAKRIQLALKTFERQVKEILDVPGDDPCSEASQHLAFEIRESLGFIEDDIEELAKTQVCPECNGKGCQPAKQKGANQSKKCSDGYIISDEIYMFVYYPKQQKN